MATANIPVGVPADIDTPPANEATLFVNPDDNNILWIKFSDGTSKRYVAGDIENCCSCEIAKNISDQIMCAFSSGLISATEFGVIMGTGINVTSTKGIDSDGNSFCKVEIGTKNIPVVSMSIDNSSPVTMLCNGTSVQLTATILPANASNKKVLWVSSNPAVVSVDVNTGLATEHTSGTVVITAITEDGNYTDSVTINSNQTGC